jgi:hypothetical protein
MGCKGPLKIVFSWSGASPGLPGDGPRAESTSAPSLWLRVPLAEGLACAICAAWDFGSLDSCAESETIGGRES